MTYQEIIYEVEAGLARIVLNRPDRLNAWTPTMEDEVRDALMCANGDPAVHAIVLTGAGRGFCAGADLKSATLGRADLPPDGAGDFDQRYSYIAAIDKPTIAAINGPVAGVGLCIALHCDLRFIADDAKLTTAFARRGTVAEHGSAWLLSRLIGPMNAFDLLVTGRTILGEEAAALGLARLVPGDGFMAAVERYAMDLITLSSPRSARVIKRQIREAMHSSLGEAVILSNAEMIECRKSHDFSEGTTAFAQGRKPSFNGT